jgi:formylglycine-generating enzyme required for sulfatase activity
MAQINPRGELFKGLRRDYPISNLGPSELDCYVAWLDAQTTGHVRLPSYSEWEWFARSGVADRKYPWGNEEDPRREALLREKILDVIYGRKPKEFIDTRLSFILLGTKVGLFPPTEWGLYDVLGNVPELTSDTIDASNIDSYRQKLGIDIGFQPGINRKRIIKGYKLLLGTPEGWKRGISGVRFVAEIDGRFSSAAGVRLVIEGE